MSSGNAAAATNGLSFFMRGSVHDSVWSSEIALLYACLLLI